MAYLLKEMEDYADEFNIPIMEKEGINYLKKIIKKNKIETILEIGTAIGYSAISMALINEKIKVTTIERDEKRYKEAIKNITKFNLENQINVIYADALTKEIKGTYDLIFIDAAKSQYIKFFKKFEKNLKPNGIIISDNMNFHGLVYSDKSKMSKNLRGLITKLEKYILFLKENDKFKTKFINIGDGIAISRKDE